MKKILLAVKNIELEDYIEEKTKETHLIVGKLVHRDGIIETIKNREPDLLIIRETIPGKEDLLKSIHYLSGKHPNLRIIFIAKDRPVGDSVLASLVSFRVYDLLRGNSVRAPEIIDLINNPNKYSDVQHFLPAPIFDEETGKLLFEAPKGLNPETKIIEVERKVYVGAPNGGPIIEHGEEEFVEEEKEKKESPFAKIERSVVNMVTKITDKPVLAKNKHVEKVAHVPTQTQTQAQKQKKIIAFIGGKRGVGTTTIAINTAMALAKEHKVIYLEMERKTPSVHYWYDLGFNSKGIDTTLSSLLEGKYREIENSIIKMRDLKKGNKKFSKFPDIDFLFYSKEYLGDPLRINNEENYKDLYLHLLLQEGYDYVIIDTISDMTDRSTMDALLYSNLVFTIITQDISSVGYQAYKTEELMSNGLDLVNKNIYILNNHIHSNFGPEIIADWLGKDSILLVPRGGNEFIESSRAGLPVTIYSSEPGINNSINKIVNTIKSN